MCAYARTLQVCNGKDRGIGGALPARDIPTEEISTLIEYHEARLDEDTNLGFVLPPKEKVKGFSPILTGGEARHDYCKIKPLIPVPDLSSSLLNPDAMYALHDYVEKYPRHRVEKGVLKPIDQHKTHAICTGYTIRDSATQTRVSEYEWASFAMENLYSSLAERMFKPTARPTASREFKAFCTVELEKMFGEFSSWMPDPPTLLEYASTNFPGKPAKTANYVRKIKEVMLTGKLDRPCFTGMVKNGEVYYGTQTGDDPFHQDAPDRPRLIWNPANGSFAFIAALQAPLFSKIKEMIPEFIHGLSTNGICEAMSENMPDDAVALSLDGTGFDATQFREMYEAVDFQIYAHLRPYFEATLAKPENNLHLSIADLYAYLHDIDRYLFLHLPGIDYKQWTPEMISRF
jgi:hypothetical protein